MKKVKYFVGLLFITAIGFSSCKKCGECHYDGPSGEVEMGEYCDDELEAIEAEGYIENGVTYEVHCGEEH